MNNYITGSVIKKLREQKQCTQKELAQELNVSDKTISKWETGKGLPDISLMENLAEALNVSVIELMTGEYITNQNRASKMSRSKFYVCPICGNVIHSVGEGTYSCCGVTLPALEAEEPDDKHLINVEKIDGGVIVSVNHEMTKEQFISFIAYTTLDSMGMKKLYPEQNPEAEFVIRGHATLYVYCNRHGLYKRTI